HAGEERPATGPPNGPVQRREHVGRSVAVPGAVADGVPGETGERGGGRTGSADVAEDQREVARVLEREQVVEVAADLGGVAVWPVPHCGVDARYVGQGRRQQAALERACDLALALAEAQVLDARRDAAGEGFGQRDVVRGVPP